MRLADAGFARERRSAAGTGQGACQSALERGKFALAADESVGRQMCGLVSFNRRGRCALQRRTAAVAEGRVPVGAIASIRTAGADCYGVAARRWLPDESG